MKSVSFTHLYSSDLGRAVETAEIISNETGHEILKVEMLRETNLGVFQSLTQSEKRAIYPGEWFPYNSSDKYLSLIHI